MLGGRTYRELTNVRAKSSRWGDDRAKSRMKNGDSAAVVRGQAGGTSLAKLQGVWIAHIHQRYGRNESPRTDVPLAFMTKAEAVKQERATRQYSVRQTPNAIHPQPVNGPGAVRGGRMNVFAAQSLLTRA